jgi:hypothetical protein
MSLSTRGLWNIEALLVPSPEVIVVDATVKKPAIVGVRKALMDLGLSPLEVAIVEHRLTSETSKELSHNGLTKLLEFSAPEVSRSEKCLVARLRTLIS